MKTFYQSLQTQEQRAATYSLRVALAEALKPLDVTATREAFYKFSAKSLEEMIFAIEQGETFCIIFAPENEYTSNRITIAPQMDERYQITNSGIVSKILPSTRIPDAIKYFLSRGYAVHEDRTSAMFFVYASDVTANIKTPIIPVSIDLLWDKGSWDMMIKNMDEVRNKTYTESKGIAYLLEHDWIVAKDVPHEIKFINRADVLENEQAMTISIPRPFLQDEKGWSKALEILTAMRQTNLQK